MKWHATKHRNEGPSGVSDVVEPNRSTNQHFQSARRTEFKRPSLLRSSEAFRRMINLRNPGGNEAWRPSSCGGSRLPPPAGSLLLVPTLE